MESWKDKRKEWVDVRDNKFKVKKGAVSGVSVGDSIDKIYASSKKGYQPLLKAIATLRKDLKKYSSKSGKSAAGLVDWIDKTFVPELDTLEQHTQADVALVAKLRKDIVEFHQVAVPGTPEMTTYNKVTKELARDPKLTWPAVAKQFGLYARTERSTPKWDEMITMLSGLKFQISLPGHKADYAYLKELETNYSQGVAFLKKFPACKTVGEHDQMVNQQVDALISVERRGFTEELYGHLDALLG